MRSHDPPLWRWFLLPVAGVVALLIAGWLFIWFLGWSISRTDVSEDGPGAKRFAERFGLRLVDGDRVVYGEVQSSFPDSGAYLVIDVETIADRERLMVRSGLRCGPADLSTLSRRRGVDHHGPGAAPALQDCTGSQRYNGDLTASFDPTDKRLGTRVYITASEM